MKRNKTEFSSKINDLLNTQISYTDLFGNQVTYNTLFKFNYDIMPFLTGDFDYTEENFQNNAVLSSIDAYTEKIE